MRSFRPPDRGVIRGAHAWEQEVAEAAKCMSERIAAGPDASSSHALIERVRDSLENTPRLTEVPNSL